MPFCYRCGEGVQNFQWSSEHGCCKDCAAVDDLDRFREQVFWCRECDCKCGVDEDGCCTSCGAQAQARFV
jgi:hypothetical protein